ncbi:MAG TPA: ABC transporter ATP-binding protein [Dehalococcoidia bacterium]|nr:ABC transporter ATP-binding protein [Dehalococcoidia bacterium]
MTEVAIEMRGLRKQYRNGVLALQNLDLEVFKGDCVGYLGPNGAGKTTTIKILANLIRPTSGNAYIYGLDVQKRPKEALCHTGFIIEVPGIYDYLTPMEMLSYLGKVRGMDKGEIEQRSKEVLETVRLSEWKDRRIGSFSTGMQRRFVIAQAILHNPEILILDEPSLGMDPEGMRDIRDIIKRLRSEGKTVFLSSHLLHEIEGLCNRVVLLDKGRVLVSDTIDALKKTSKVQRIKVEFLSPPTAEQIAAIRSMESVKDVSVVNAEAKLDFDGEKATSSQILTRLVSLGLEVVSYQPEVATLEDVYIAIMGKEGEVK